MFFIVFAAGMAAFRNVTEMCFRLSREPALKCKVESAGRELTEPSHHCGIYYVFVYTYFLQKNLFQIITKTSKTPLLLSEAYGHHFSLAHLCLRASTRTKNKPSIGSPGEPQKASEEKT